MSCDQLLVIQARKPQISCPSAEQSPKPALHWQHFDVEEVSNMIDSEASQLTNATLCSSLSHSTHLATLTVWNLLIICFTPISGRLIIIHNQKAIAIDTKRGGNKHPPQITLSNHTLYKNRPQLYNFDHLDCSTISSFFQQPIVTTS